MKNKIILEPQVLPANSRSAKGIDYSTSRSFDLRKTSDWLQCERSNSSAKSEYSRLPASVLGTRDEGAHCFLLRFYETRQTPSVVLYVDDQPDCAFLFERACVHARAQTIVKTAFNGFDAISYLSGAHEYADRKLFPQPEMLFLDLNMPVLSGFEVLKWISRQPELSTIPSYIITSSSDPKDAEKARDLGAAGYIIKPFGIDRLTEVISVILL